ncbi:hypothetical protein MUY27_19530 [Mucilaginibacter sp. RS28]|uniref:Uncharacterized protein n=1 Tax=Mucilaginibacter straminoryzae TaxID=2932774 RepID=A0A9X2BAJ9_9SPHI|nr:hypothetical protein [Mucilaginibacter straminoryzae]MCJ8211919.1 hypothetical protein [Mucilaginibacter straminoryzae]
MTKPANNPHKPSPSDTPTDRPEDNGNKTIQRPEDKDYDAENADFGNVDKTHREDEEPVNPIKTPPTENEGMKQGKVQPD